MTPRHKAKDADALRREYLWKTSRNYRISVWATVIFAPIATFLIGWGMALIIGGNTQ